MNKVLILFFSHSSVFVINFILSIMVARYLGPELRGEYAFIMLLVNLIPTIANFGSISSLPYLLRNDGYQYGAVRFKIIYLSILFSFLSSLIVSITFVLKFNNNIQYYFEPTVIFIFLLANIFSLKIWFQKIVIAHGFFKSYSWLTLFASALLLVSTSIVIYKKGSIFEFIIAQLFVNFIILVIYIFLSSKEEKKSTKSKPLKDNHFYSSVLAYSKYAFPGDLANRLNLRLDQIVISFVLSSSSLGIYVISVVICEMIFAFMQALGMVLFRRIANSPNKEDQKNLMEKVSRIIFAFSIPAGIIFAMAFYHLIPLLYGENFNDAKYVLLLYLPGVLLYNIHSIISKYFAAIGFVKLNTYAQIFSLIISAPFLFYLTSSMGILGAALGSTITYSLCSLFSIFYYYKMRNKFVNLFVVSKADMVFLYQSLKNTLRRAGGKL